MVDLFLTGWRKPEPQPGHPSTVRELVAVDRAQTTSVTFAVEYREWQDLVDALFAEAKRNERFTILVQPEAWQITNVRPIDQRDQRY